MENRAPRHTFKQAGAKVQRMDQPGCWAVVVYSQYNTSSGDMSREYWQSIYGENYVSTARYVYTCQRVVLGDPTEHIILESGKNEIFFPCYHVGNSVLHNGALVWLEPAPSLDCYLIYTFPNRLAQSSYAPLCLASLQSLCVERDNQGRITNIYYINQQGDRVVVPNCLQGSIFRCIPWNVEDYILFVALFDNYHDSINAPGVYWELDSGTLRWEPVVPLGLGSTFIRGIGDLRAQLSVRPIQWRELPNGQWNTNPSSTFVSPRLTIQVGLRVLDPDMLEVEDVYPPEEDITVMLAAHGYTHNAAKLYYPDDLDVEFQGCDRDLTVTVTIKPGRWASGTIRILPIPDPP